MGVWKISDLDKSKTEQSITNELTRLDDCKITLKRLREEYKERQRKYQRELDSLNERIINLERSIDSGAKFVEECIRHLKTFD